MVTTTDCVQKNPMSFCRLTIPCSPNDDGKTRIVTKTTTHSYKSHAQYAVYDCACILIIKQSYYSPHRKYKFFYHNHMGPSIHLYGREGKNNVKMPEFSFQNQETKRWLFCKPTS
jgi:hypothetical protein